MYENKDIWKSRQTANELCIDDTPLTTAGCLFVCRPFSKSRAVLYFSSILLNHIFRDSVSFDIQGSVMLDRRIYDPQLRTIKKRNRYETNNIET